MTPAELIEYASDNRIQIVEGIDPTSAKLVRGYLAVSGLVVIPIHAVGSFIGRDDDIELQDKNGSAAGTVCFTNSLGQVVASDLTRWQYAAFLAEVETSQIGAEYSFRGNYVVVDEGFAQDYLDNYSAGAPLWGGYSHVPLAVREAGPNPGYIVGNPDIQLPTVFHEQALNRYIEATNAFDRFLKLYHTLELLFDYVVLKQMRQVGDDLQQFGKIMNDYERPEIDRLRFLIQNYCGDSSVIADGFSAVCLHLAKAEEIFQNHAKTGNPLKEAHRWGEFIALANAGAFAEADFRSKNFVNKNTSYLTFVSSLAAYWIYRVRSSIAHSRVGEFLFVDSDEKFITEFAEPLLLDVVNQVFENSRLKHLATV